MFGEIPFTLNPENISLANSAYNNNLFSIYHGRHQLPEINFNMQNNIDYYQFGSQYMSTLQDCFWKNYYSNFSIEFSKSIQVYSSSPYKNVTENTSVTTPPPSQEQTALTTSYSRTFVSSKNVQIWRPFSPAPSLNDTVTPLAEMENIERKNGFVTDFRTKFRPTVSSGVKFGHSNSSVFTPFKKKSYKCKKCSETFLTSSELNSHMRYHAGVKPFICDHPNCSKTFARNEELTRHRRIHSGYKPHLCHVCSKRFGRKDHLSKHLKTHLQVSEKKIYACCELGCGHRYTRSDALTRHKSTAHANPKPQIIKTTVENNV